MISFRNQENHEKPIHYVQKWTMFQWNRKKTVKCTPKDYRNVGINECFPQTPPSALNETSVFLEIGRKLTIECYKRYGKYRRIPMIPKTCWKIPMQKHRYSKCKNDIISIPLPVRPPGALRNTSIPAVISRNIDGSEKEPFKKHSLMPTFLQLSMIPLYQNH